MNRLLSNILPFLFMAHSAYAATFAELTDTFLTQLVNPLIKIMIGLAMVVFIWGIVEFIAKAGSEEGRTTGKKHIIWGLIGFTIMFSVFGIIQILKSIICPDAGCPESL